MIKIYKLTSPSGKGYIGQTVRLFNKRLNEHKNNSSSPKLRDAIQKYSWKNFKTEIVDEVSESIADVIESFLIQYFDTIKNGYNLATGGNKNKHLSEETKKKMSEAQKGKKRPEISRENHPFYGKKRPDFSGENHPFYGKKRPEHSERMKGKNHPLYGKSRSEETREKIRVALKGIKRPEHSERMKGKTLTEKHKKKISEKMKLYWNSATKRKEK